LRNPADMPFRCQADECYDPQLDWSSSYSRLEGGERWQRETAGATLRPRPLIPYLGPRQAPLALSFGQTEGAAPWIGGHPRTLFGRLTYRFNGIVGAIITKHYDHTRYNHAGYLAGYSAGSFRFPLQTPGLAQLLIRALRSMGFYRPLRRPKRPHAPCRYGNGDPALSAISFSSLKAKAYSLLSVIAPINLIDLLWTTDSLCWAPTPDCSPMTTSVPTPGHRLSMISSHCSTASANYVMQFIGHYVKYPYAFLTLEAKATDVGIKAEARRRLHWILA